MIGLAQDQNNNFIQAIQVQIDYFNSALTRLLRLVNHERLSLSMYKGCGLTQVHLCFCANSTVGYIR